MKKSIIIFVFFLSVNLLSGQSDLSFIQVDTSTYRAYINNDWNRIIKIGEQAVDQQIDYYYLRLRIAYAYFKKNRFRKSIPHYRKALEYSHNDATASEFLYFCYLYSGRVNDAIKFKSSLPTPLRNYIDKRKSKTVTQFGTYLTFGNGVNDNLKAEIIKTSPTTVDGSQLLPNKQFNFNSYLNHKMGSLLLVRHSINILYKDEYAQTVVNAIPYLSESQIVRQFNYSLALDITPFYGFTITPSVSYINYRIPVFYDYGVGLSKNRAIYTYNSFNEVAIGLNAKKQFGILETALAVTHANFNLSKQYSMGFLLTVYPLGNLNLYYSGALFHHLQEQNSIVKTQFIHSHKVGLKVFKNMWIEGVSIFGGFTNFYDPFTQHTYNSVEKYNSILGINLVFPFSKSGRALFLGFRSYNSETMFVPVNDVFTTYNAEKIKYQSITGGISWNF